MDRFYSSMTIEKAFDDGDERVIEGFASTADIDRVGDIVEPEGVVVRGHLPLLWQHNSDMPIGTVEKWTATKKGIKFRARIAKVDAPPLLKNRLDEAWASVKAGLIRAVSIGFRAIERAYMENDGVHFQKWEWFELSLVTVPANPAATITQTRAYFDERGVAAAKARRSVALTPARVAANSKQSAKGTQDMKIADQIKSLEEDIKRKHERRTDIQTKAVNESRAKDTAEKEEFDRLGDEVKVLDEELADLKDLEASEVKRATPVAGRSEADASASRARAIDDGATAVRFGADRGAKGVRFAQAVKCATIAKLSGMSATELAREQYSYDARVEQIVKGIVTKAAVGGAVPTTAAWGGNIAPTIEAMGEFIEYLWPATILGQLGNVTPYPFGYKVPRETTPAGAAWVGAGAPIPVSAPVWDNVTIGRTKLGGLLVSSKENLRFASIEADTAFRNDLIKAITALVDGDFVNPANAGTANVKPASITNGLTAIAPSGTDVTALRTDLQKLLAPLILANLSLSGVSILMREDMALAISMMVNALEQPAFPEIAASGGTLMGGIRVIASNSVQPGDLIAVHGPSIGLAKDNVVEIDVSGDASIEMDDAPSNSAATGTGASVVSMFQTDSFAFKATMFANWIKTRSAAVSYIGVGAYGGAASA